MAVTSRNEYVIGLDVLRLLAALLVAFFHLAYWSWAPSASTTKNLFPEFSEIIGLTPFAWWGWVGVEIFFVISGFVIFASSENLCHRAFAMKRLLRLAPNLWICSSLTFLVLTSINGFNSNDLILYLKTITLTPFSPWVDGVYWTLVVEVAFYCLIWVALRSGWSNNIEGFAYAAAAASAVAWITVWFSSIASMELAELLTKVMRHWLFTVLLLRHAIFFSLGMFLYLIFREGLTFARVAICVACIIAAYLEIADVAEMRSASVGVYLPSTTPFLAFLFAILLMIILTVFNEAIKAKVFRNGLANMVRTVGLATYPFYLLHNVIGSFFINTLSSLFPIHASLFGSLIILLCISVFISMSLEPVLRTILRAAFGPSRRPISTEQIYHDEVKAADRKYTLRR